MRQEYLGDSYDIVKRLWHDLFWMWAPLLAAPQFIPHELGTRYTAMTRIPMLGDHPPQFYSILNDPDTGIRLPSAVNQTEGLSHITLSTIYEQLRDPAVRCVITFDQSTHRRRGLSPADQRAAKLRWLREKDKAAFYFVSHAPFLFAFSSNALRTAAVDLLIKGGIPETRVKEMT